MRHFLTFMILNLSDQQSKIFNKDKDNIKINKVLFSVDTLKGR